MGGRKEEGGFLVKIESYIWISFSFSLKVLLKICVLFGWSVGVLECWVVDVGGWRREVRPRAGSKATQQRRGEERMAGDWRQ